MLDHEVFHLVFPATASKTAQSEETGCDIYAAAKALQRSGAGEDISERLAYAVAMSLIVRKDGEHFSTFALQDFARRKDKINPAGLTPRKMTVMAARLADKHALSEEKLDGIARAFRKIPKHGPKSVFHEKKVCETIARCILEEGVGKDAFRAGMTVLRHYFETGESYHGKKMDLSGKKWTNLREKLRQKEELLFKAKIRPSVRPG